MIPEMKSLPVGLPTKWGGICSRSVISDPAKGWHSVYGLLVPPPLEGLSQTTFFSLAATMVQHYPLGHDENLMR